MTKEILYLSSLTKRKKRAKVCHWAQKGIEPFNYVGTSPISKKKGFIQKYYVSEYETISIS
jgi:hypothetical protein